MCSSFLVGEGAILKSARPFVSFCHSSSHFSKRSLLRWAFPALFKKGNGIWGAVCLVSISWSFPFLFFTFRHPVASLAATSASSFPSISIWAGTQWSSGLIPFSRSALIDPTINLNICCPDWLSGFCYIHRLTPFLAKLRSLTSRGRPNQNSYKLQVSRKTKICKLKIIKYLHHLTFICLYIYMYVVYVMYLYTVHRDISLTYPRACNSTVYLNSHRRRHL